MILDKERTDITRHAHAAHQPGKQHGLWPQIRVRSEQPETLGHRLIPFPHHFPHRLPVDRIDRYPSGVQGIRISHQEQLKTLRGEGDVRYLRAGEEVFPEIIQPPSEVKPNIHPRQIFHDMPKRPPETPPRATINEVRQQPGDTSINEAIADREREPRGDTRKNGRDIRINRPGIPLAPGGTSHHDPHAYQQDHQQNPAKAYPETPFPNTNAPHAAYGL